jgi:hypothetical protein
VVLFEQQRRGDDDEVAPPRFKFATETECLTGEFNPAFKQPLKYNFEVTISGDADDDTSDDDDDDNDDADGEEKRARCAARQVELQAAASAELNNTLLKLCAFTDDLDRDCKDGDIGEDNDLLGAFVMSQQELLDLTEEMSTSTYHDTGQNQYAKYEDVHDKIVSITTIATRYGSSTHCLTSPDGTHVVSAKRGAATITLDIDLTVVSVVQRAVQVSVAHLSHDHNLHLANADSDEDVVADLPHTAASSGRSKNSLIMITARMQHKRRNEFKNLTEGDSDDDSDDSDDDDDDDEDGGKKEVVNKFKEEFDEDGGFDDFDTPNGYVGQAMASPSRKKKIRLVSLNLLDGGIAPGGEVSNSDSDSDSERGSPFGSPVLGGGAFSPNSSMRRMGATAFASGGKSAGSNEAAAAFSKSTAAKRVGVRLSDVSRRRMAMRRVESSSSVASDGDDVDDDDDAVSEKHALALKEHDDIVNTKLLIDRMSRDNSPEKEKRNSMRSDEKERAKQRRSTERSTRNNTANNTRNNSHSSLARSDDGGDLITELPAAGTMSSPQFAHRRSLTGRRLSLSDLHKQVNERRSSLGGGSIGSIGSGRSSGANSGRNSGRSSGESSFRDSFGGGGSGGGADADIAVVKTNENDNDGDNSDKERKEESNDAAADIDDYDKSASAANADANADDGNTAVSSSLIDENGVPLPPPPLHRGTDDTSHTSQERQMDRMQSLFAHDKRGGAASVTAADDDGDDNNDDGDDGDDTDNDNEGDDDDDSDSAFEESAGYEDDFDADVAAVVEFLKRGHHHDSRSGGGGGGSSGGGGGGGDGALIAADVDTDTASAFLKKWIRDNDATNDADGDGINTGGGGGGGVGSGGAHSVLMHLDALRRRGNTYASLADPALIVDLKAADVAAAEERRMIASFLNDADTGLLAADDDDDSDGDGDNGDGGSSRVHVDAAAAARVVEAAPGARR